jgi:predicted phage-related endonuclease
MSYTTHSFAQGTPEWHAHREGHYNSSLLAAAMGVSTKIKRDQLVESIATGKEKEFSEWFEKNILAEGHRFERLARALADKIVGETLFPSTVSCAVEGLSRPLSASLDGTTICGKINWEHKSLNAELAKSLAAGIIPDEYHPQMEQGMMINLAEKCLFMASRWAEDGTLIEEMHVWYYPNAELRAKIVPTWNQVAADAAVYVPPVTVREPVAAPQIHLPALSVQVTGSIAVIDNLKVFGEALTDYIAKINKKPQTDDDFATLKAQVKILKGAEDALTAAESNALGQAADIDALRRTVALYKDAARHARLTAEKTVDTEEKARKAAIAFDGGEKFRQYKSELESKFPADKPMEIPDINCNFQVAIKGLRTIASVHNAVNTELARLKIEADALFAKISRNLTVIAEQKDFASLFHDYRQLAVKETEYVELEVQKRVKAAKAEQARKLEEQREQIANEERAKIEKEMSAKQNAEERDRLAGIAFEAAKIPAAKTTPANASPIRPSVTAAHSGPVRSISLADLQITISEISAALSPLPISASVLYALDIPPVEVSDGVEMYRVADFRIICDRISALASAATI